MDDNLWVLKDAERDLLRELEPERLAELDEDQLLALHKRVRRARTKHVKNYRRGASRKVEDAGARGAAKPTSEKARLRASVFEEALSVVSAELARVAHEEAEALRDERLAAARAVRWNGGSPDSPAPDVADSPGVARAHTPTTGGIKRDASSSAQGRQRQAKRDAT
ncbi:hypothetical protein [Cellulomonas sp. S1-8]|uniref:hypothetical protein n=1 Tax=Cellulomonas sp. S1-8 TaxID=2904790 RepID=UPI002243897D|nr:hypothetical protein [Cellulomonas sp. S1-8]UZN01626.1 hypothetical protein OKX07_10960 [Cellulomonas sp. S1-8]